jgi:hypothetical protein
VTVTSIGKAKELDSLAIDPQTFQEHIKALPKLAKWTIQHLQHTDDGRTLADEIRRGTAIAVSNGGLKLGIGTAAFVIEGRNSINRMKGVNRVPGPIQEGDSHRCEMAGIYVVIKLVEVICKTHKVSGGGIRICCDNTSALQMFDQEYLPDPSHKNFDLISACWKTKNSIPIQWTPQHVKGHQDRLIPIHALSREAQLNVEADKAASAY